MAASSADVVLDGLLDEVGSRWSDEAPSFDRQFPFDPAQWRAGPAVWRSLFTLPSVLDTGGLASFGEDARRLLTEHYTNRLQITVLPDVNTRVRACIDHTRVEDGAEHKERAGAVVAVRITESPLNLGVSLFGNGRRGRIQTSAVVHSWGWPRVSAFGTWGAALHEQLRDQEGTMSVGVAVNEPNFRGALVAKNSKTLGEWGERFAGNVVARVGPIQVGADATLVAVDEDDLNLHDGEMHTLGDSGWAVERGSLRATYTATSARHFTGEPESYQIGVSIESLGDLGDQLAASYFHHIAIRESGVTEPYWRSISFGGEFIQRRTIDSNSASNHVALGAQWQLSRHFAAKARCVSSGSVDVAAAARGRDLFGLFPSIELVVSAGLSVLRQPSLGLTCMVGD